jgi:hypothetical protein
MILGFFFCFFFPFSNSHRALCAARDCADIHFSRASGPRQGGPKRNRDEDREFSLISFVSSFIFVPSYSSLLELMLQRGLHLSVRKLSSLCASLLHIARYFAAPHCILHLVYTFAALPLVEAVLCFRYTYACLYHAVNPV